MTAIGQYDKVRYIDIRADDAWLVNTNDEGYAIKVSRDRASVEFERAWVPHIPLSRLQLVQKAQPVPPLEIVYEAGNWQIARGKYRWFMDDQYCLLAAGRPVRWFQHMRLDAIIAAFEQADLQALSYEHYKRVRAFLNGTTGTDETSHD